MSASKKSTYQVFSSSGKGSKGQYAISEELYNKQKAIKLRNSFRKQYPLARVEVYKIELI